MVLLLWLEWPLALEEDPFPLPPPLDCLELLPPCDPLPPFPVELLALDACLDAGDECLDEGWWLALLLGLILEDDLWILLERFA